MCLQPRENHNKAAARAIRDSSPDPEQKLAHEFVLTTLSKGPSKPTLVLTDLEGKYDNFVDALSRRNFVREESPQRFVITDAGKNSRVVLVGDTNDRRAKFVEIVRLIHSLRQQGLEIRTVVGNHEFFLNSFLFLPLPEQAAVEELGIHDVHGRLIRNIPLTQLDRQKEYETWIFDNGGDATISSILGNLDPALNISRFSNDLTEALNKARQIVSEQPEFKAFREQMEAFVRDDNLIFTHSAPILYEGMSVNESQLRVDQLFKQIWNSPEMSWVAGCGVKFFELQGKLSFDNPANDPKSISSVYHGPLTTLVWSRLPNGIILDQNPFEKVLMYSRLNPQNLTRLADQGIDTIVRGHDSLFHLGANKQSDLKIGRTTIINASIASYSPVKGYTFLTPAGQVFASFDAAA